MANDIRVSFEMNEPTFSSFEQAIAPADTLRTRTSLAKQLTLSLRGKLLRAHRLGEAALELLFDDAVLRLETDAGVVRPRILERPSLEAGEGAFEAESYRLDTGDRQFDYHPHQCVRACLNRRLHGVELSRSFINVVFDEDHGLAIETMYLEPGHRPALYLHHDPDVWGRKARDSERRASD